MKMDTVSALLGGPLGNEESPRLQIASSKTAGVFAGSTASGVLGSKRTASFSLLSANGTAPTPLGDCRVTPNNETSVKAAYEMLASAGLGSWPPVVSSRLPNNKDWIRDE